jgi:hypothetical protein
MTEEQRKNRNNHQREYMRERRAQKKAQKAATASLEAQTVQTPVPSAKDAPNPIVKRDRLTQPTVRAQDLANYDDVSAQKAKNLQRAWRGEASEYLLDVLTRAESPITGAGMRSSQMLCFWFKLSEKLDRIVEQDRPDQTQEFTLAVLLECLRRLTGEEKTGSPALVLPGTR